MVEGTADPGFIKLLSLNNLLVEYPGELQVNLWEHIGIIVLQKG